MVLVDIKVQQDYEALKGEQDLEKQREAKPFLEATFSFNMTKNIYLIKFFGWEMTTYISGNV